MKAAELAEDWEEEGEEEKGEEKIEKVEKTAEKTEEKSEKMAEAEVDTTPVRKSGRAPKPTEKLLEGKQQVSFKQIARKNGKMEKKSFPYDIFPNKGEDEASGR